MRIADKIRTIVGATMPSTTKRYYYGIRKRDQRKNGLFIVFVGPDGVGKTTLSNEIERLVRWKFAEVRYFHWRPVLSVELSKIVPEGGKFVAKQVLPNFLDRLFSPIRLLRHVALFELGYRIKIYPALCKGKLVIGDRYIYPYYYAPASVKYFGPRWLVDIAVRVVSKPDLVFCLHGNALLIHGRKPELAINEIRAQMDLCLSVFARQPNCVLINVNETLDTTVTTILDAICATLQRRERC